MGVMTLRGEYRTRDDTNEGTLIIGMTFSITLTNHFSLYAVFLLARGEIYPQTYFIQ